MDLHEQSECDVDHIQAMHFIQTSMNASQMNPQRSPFQHAELFHHYRRLSLHSTAVLKGRTRTLPISTMDRMADACYNFWL
jgi:hypothetical protein